MQRKILSEAELRGSLADLESWKAVDNRIQRRFEFADFSAALDFVNKVGSLAEEADHHPDITFGWGYAEIALTTHDRGGVTDVDIALAAGINAI
ncbi:MAG: 4a-hydroxytetrahydrobiopterin dehydratase [Acidobacteriota bacterium]|nr:MAG: 4a-hydroxytetrahydrobiopterin dehydratase [Acidobacteriota bacterium]